MIFELEPRATTGLHLGGMTPIFHSSIDRHFPQALFFPADRSLDKGPGDRQRAKDPLTCRRNREGQL